MSIVNMFSLEKHSLKAISELETKQFYYAATLLVYVVLERYLKLYLLQNRKSLTENEVELDKTLGRENLKLVKFRDLSDESFIQQFLVKLTLGNLEILYRIPRKKYSNLRNKVFHSDLYMTKQLRNNKQLRDAKNRRYLRAAKKHLIEASKHYFHQEIITSTGSLQFKSQSIA